MLVEFTWTITLGTMLLLAFIIVTAVISFLVIGRLDEKIARIETTLITLVRTIQSWKEAWHEPEE